jgi:undecaprenyl-diphosphatase
VSGGEARLRIRRIARCLGQADGGMLFVLVSLLLLVSGVWTFVEIADAVSERETHALDVRLLERVRDPDQPRTLRGPPWMADAARDVTALGSPVLLTLFTGLVAGYLLLRRARASALLTVATVAGVVAVYSVLKATFQRERPSEVPALVDVESHGFPSGHSAIAAVVYLSLAVTLARLEPHRRARAYIIAVGVSLAFLVGVSRVVLGVHDPSDVLAGWAVGLAWASGSWLLAIWMERSPVLPAGLRTPAPQPDRTV